MTQIIIYYNPEKENPPRGKGTYRGLDKIKLKAGRNTYDPSVYEELKEHPVYKQLQGTGAVQVISEAATAPLEKTLSGLKAPEAIALITKTNSVKELEKWREAEASSTNRTTIINAIANQIQSIERGQV